jgi:hypothetical protein
VQLLDLGVLGLAGMMSCYEMLEPLVVCAFLTASDAIA